MPNGTEIQLVLGLNPREAIFFEKKSDSFHSFFSSSC